MKKVFVKTQNVKDFITLTGSLQNKPEGISRMALVYGEPGLGKSRTALWWAIQNDAVYLRSSNMMTGRWFLKDLAEELGEYPNYWTADVFRQCENSLLKNPRTLIIDEIDYLLGDKNSIETIRDLHDKTNAPIILVGMPMSEKRLVKYRPLYDRLSEIIRFNSFTYSDIKEIINQLSEIPFNTESIEMVHKQSCRFRQITRIISKCEIIAKNNQISEITENILMEIVKNDKRENIKAG